MNDEEIKTLFNVVDKLEKRIFLLEKVVGKLQLRLGDVVLYIDKKEEQSWVNYVKVRVVICKIHKTGSEDQKETKEIKLEQLDIMVMAMEIFVLLIVRTIGGKNMEQEQLTTQVD